MQSDKKISFGFNKITKKPNVLSKPAEKKVELVECLEGQSIKIKDAVEVIEDEPLVIPLKDDQRNLLDRIRNSKSKSDESKKEQDERPDSELTIEELAVREVIRDAQNRLANKNPTETGKVLSLPTKEDGLVLEGEKEPTLDDYESIPIGDFGMAMLRGMGWKEGMAIGKNSANVAAVSVPELRPKGLGLGASKLVAEAPKGKTVDKEGNELNLIKGGFAKIIAGPQKGNYCEVLGFDDEAGRVIVKTSIKSEILNLNEFMIVPVGKEEFSKGSKVINNAKYEEYKEKSDKNLELQRQNIKSENGNSSIKKEEICYSSDEEKYKPHSSKKHSSKYSSSNEDDSLEDEKHSKKTDRNREKSRNRSSSSSEEEHRRRRNEKKTKSSRRDRSRSRNKKSKSRHRHRSSSSEEEYKKKSKKNKCKSRHRRNSSSEAREYRKNKR